MSLLQEYKKCKAENKPVDFIYDFLFKHYDSPMDEHDPMDLLDVLIDDRIYAKTSGLPVDIIMFDYGLENFPRYHTPMVAVDGTKGSLLWNHLVPVSISESPEILISDELLHKRSNLTHDEWNTILEYISKNHKILLAQWNCENGEK